jgi:ArsR family transcriptional regulator
LKRPYEIHAELFKALADPNRLQILDMLCKGELCACKILEKFNISQPTLSHHMKILCDCGIVDKRKAGKWMYYSIAPGGCEKIITLFRKFTAVMEKECSGKNKCNVNKECSK